MNEYRLIKRTGSSILLLIALLYTGTAATTDLDRAVALAMQHDPTLQASKYARRAGNEKRSQARSLYLPSLSVDAGVGYMWSTTRLSAPSDFAFKPVGPLRGKGHVHGYGITLLQPIYNARIPLKATKLRGKADISDIEYAVTRQKLMMHVAEAYFHIIMAQDTLATLKAEQAAVNHQLAGAKARFDAGRADITDVQDAQSRHDVIAAQRVTAQNALAEWQARYRRLVGHPADHLQPLSEHFAATPPKPDKLTTWLTWADSDNPNVRIKQIRTGIAEQNTDMHTLTGRPRIDLMARYSDIRPGDGLTTLIVPERMESTLVGLRLSIPVYVGGRLRSERREAEAGEEQARYDLRAARADAWTQVRQAFNQVSASVHRIDALAQSMKTAHTALEANQLALKVGSRTMQDVLEAQHTYYQTRDKLNQARYQHILATFRLRLLTGRLDNAYVHRISRLLSRPDP